MQEVPSAAPSRGKRSVKSALKLIPWFAGLAVAAACALYAHHHGIENGWVFVGLNVVTSAAMAFMTLCFDGWFGRPSHGTSGPIGVAMIWLMVRTAALAIIVASGFIGVWSYAATYMAAIIACGILDSLYIIASL